MKQTGKIFLILLRKLQIKKILRSIITKIMIQIVHPKAKLIRRNYEKNQQNVKNKLINLNSNS